MRHSHMSQNNNGSSRDRMDNARPDTVTFQYQNQSPDIIDGEIAESSDNSSASSCQGSKRIVPGIKMPCTPPYMSHDEVNSEWPNQISMIPFIPEERRSIISVPTETKYEHFINNELIEQSPLLQQNNEGVEYVTMHSDIDYNNVNETKILVELLISTIEVKERRIIDLEKSRDADRETLKQVLERITLLERKDAARDSEKQDQLSKFETSPQKKRKIESVLAFPPLPLKNVAAVNELELYLKNNNQAEVIDKLARTGGRDWRVAARRVMKELIDNECALQFNWAGTKRKNGKSKLAFNKFSNIFKVIFGAIEKIVGKKGSPQLIDVEDYFQKWLKSAPQRIASASRSGTGFDIPDTSKRKIDD